MNSRTQAGLEYLVTYGWALILVAAVVGVLVLTVAAPVEGATFSSADPTKLMVKGATIANGQATIKLQNITGGEIKIVRVTEHPNYQDCAIIPQTVAAGGEIEIVCKVVGEPTGSVDVIFDDYAGLEQTVAVSGGVG